MLKKVRLEGRQTTERFESIDSLRGLAALMVVIYHVPLLWWLHDTRFVRNSWLFVDFFFVLSGFAIAFSSLDKIRTKRDVLNFMIRRFGRVWPLHATVLTFMVFVQFGVFLVLSHTSLRVPDNKPFEGPWSLGALPAHYAMLHASGFMPKIFYWNAPSWSISAEFCAYIIFGVLTLVMGRKFFIAAIILSIVGLFLVAVFSRKYLFTLADWGLARCFYGFFLGCNLTLISRKLPELSFKTATMLEFALLFFSTLYIVFSGVGPSSYYAPFVFSFVIVVFSKQLGFISRLLLLAPFKWLGKHSYTIYIIHMPVLMISGYILKSASKFIPNVIFVSGELEENGLSVLTSYSLLIDNFCVIVILIVTLLISANLFRLVEDPGRRLANKLSRPLIVLPKSG